MAKKQTVKKQTAKKLKEIPVGEHPYYDKKGKKVILPIRVNGEEFDLVLLEGELTEAAKDIAGWYEEAFNEYIDEVRQEEEEGTRNSKKKP